MTKIGRYELLEQLGEGAYAVVWLARDTAPERKVALKVLKPALIADGTSLERFRREAQVLAGLVHPQIAFLWDMGQEGEKIYLAVRYIEGPSLEQRLKDGPLPWAQALEVVRQVAAALGFAHSRGVLHRDVKPANIILGKTEGAVLTDFGLAQAMQAGSLTRSGTLIGTPQYIPPEVWDGQPAGPASDQYALACILAEMLSGKALFAGPSLPAIMARHMQPPQFPAQWPADAPPGLSAVLEKALAKDPARRYPSAEEFVQALAKLDAQTQQTQQRAAERAHRSPRSPKPTRQPALRSTSLPAWAWIVGGIAVLFILVAALAGVGALVAQNQREAVALTQAAQTQSALAVPANPTAPIAVATDTPATLTPLPTTAALLPTIRPSNTPAPRATSTPAAPAGMVLIPAGTFQMGSDADDALAECQKFRSDCRRDWFTDEEPVHTVNLTNDFYMDIYEVTNAQYAECVAVGECSEPSSGESYSRSSYYYYGNPTYNNYPVIYVSRNQAGEYCTWRDARLPTEAEWEYAARGGLEGMDYPWGDTFDGSRANYCDTNCPFNHKDTSNNDGHLDTAPVGSYAPNGYGLYDMAGNVREWVADWYGGYPSGSITNPDGPANGDFHVLRGGAWDVSSYYLRVAARYWRSPANPNLDDGGFRCARSP